MVNFESTFSPGEGFGTTSYSYVYNGGQLSQMTVTTQTETHTVDLTYDASGNPQTMTYDGVTYYYTVNIQGDVTGIVDENGNVLVRYTYQAYGTTTFYGVPTGSVGSTLRQINPITYRGYVYDKETKLYYLQSRYYNRTTGRFINADSLVTTGQGLLGNNMFAYCGNNPVMRTDPTGNKYIWFQLFEDHQFGFIHRAVQEHILFFANAEAIVLGKEAVIPGGGRADIIDLETREIWEIKHGGRSETMQSRRAVEAYDQLKKYLRADKTLVTGRQGRFEGTFVINDADTSYAVFYWTPDPGVILYLVQELPEKSPYPFREYVRLPQENLAKYAYLAFAFAPIMEPIAEEAYG